MCCCRAQQAISYTYTVELGVGYGYFRASSNIWGFEVQDLELCLRFLSLKRGIWNFELKGEANYRLCQFLVYSSGLRLASLGFRQTNLGSSTYLGG